MRKSAYSRNTATQPGAPRVTLFVSSKQKWLCYHLRSTSLPAASPEITASRGLQRTQQWISHSNCPILDPWSREEEHFPEAGSVSPRCPAPISRALHLSATHLTPTQPLPLPCQLPRRHPFSISSPQDFFLKNSFIDRYFTYHKIRPFKEHNSVFLVDTQNGKHHPYLILEHLYHPCAHQRHVPFPLSPKPLATTT